MKAYRFKGRAERFPGCGKLLINPIITTNLITMKKFVKDFVKTCGEENRAFNLILEEISIADFSAALVLDILQTHDVEKLVIAKKNIDSWVGEHDKELATKQKEAARKKT